MQIGPRAIAILSGVLLAASAEPTTVAGFVATARDADIVILGEVHDNPAHHRNQAEIVAALQPAALVLEMIPQAAEDEVNALRERGADRGEIAAALDWDESGWPDFALYAEVLEAAPRARVFGAGQPAADVRRAAVEGAAGVFGPDAAAYGLDRALPADEQAAREAALAAAHCDELPTGLLPGMVEAQRFRDAGLADAALWARTMTGNGQVVVIAGSGHADRERGVPAALAVANPELRVLSLGQLEQAPEDAEAFDAYLLAPAPPRDDPCAALRPER
jgi:uncharacterized iron-regulated protein